MTNEGRLRVQLFFVAIGFVSATRFEQLFLLMESLVVEGCRLIMS